MGIIHTKSPHRGKSQDGLEFRDHDDRANTSLFVSRKVWARFDRFARSQGHTRSKLIEAMIIREMQKGE